MGKTLGKMTGATGRLDALTLGVFREFAMCFSDPVSTNRQPVDRLAALVGSTSGADHLIGLTGGVISLTAHVGNWELAGRLLARRAARTTHVVVAEEEGRELERWVGGNGDGVHFVTRSRPTVSLTLVAALRRGEVVPCRATGAGHAVTRSCRSSATSPPSAGAVLAGRRRGRPSCRPSAFSTRITSTGSS